MRQSRCGQLGFACVGSGTAVEVSSVMLRTGGAWQSRCDRYWCAMLKDRSGSRGVVRSVKFRYCMFGQSRLVLDCCA